MKSSPLDYRIQSVRKALRARLPIAHRIEVARKYRKLAEQEKTTPRRFEVHSDLDK
ncbi:MAG: hypothetical protein P1U85_03720 [Verrucomicrobiales bacterium]|nr:hypothetical protein [Verrucomicrobiales bacterium]